MEWSRDSEGTENVLNVFDIPIQPCAVFELAMNFVGDIEQKNSPILKVLLRDPKGSFVCNYNFLYSICSKNGTEDNRPLVSCIWRGY